MTPENIFVTGFMGAGKTTAGRLLAARLNYRFVDLDEAIVNGEGRTIASIFESDGEARFRAIESRYLRERLEPGTVVALGGGTFLDPQNRKLIEERGLSIWLKADPEQVLARVSNDGTRPLLMSAESVRQLYEQRQPAYLEAKVHVSTDRRTASEVANVIAGIIGAA